MSVPSTGFLNFNWDTPDVAFTNFIVDIYLNNSFFQRQELPKNTNTYSISGLAEGASCYLSITPSNRGSKYSKSKIITDTQIVPVFNNGEKINITSMQVNGENLNFELNEYGSYYTGFYKSSSRSNNFTINMSSPRDGEAFHLREDPIFDKIVYKKYSRGAPIVFSNYSSDDPIDVSNALSYELENQVVDSTYSTNSINIVEKQEDYYALEFDVLDVHGQSNVAFISVEYDPIQIKNAEINLISYTGNQSLYNLKIDQNYRISYFDYKIYDDPLYSNIITQGRSVDAQSASFLIDSSITGYPVLFPHGDFSSGIEFFDSPIVFPKIEATDQNNSLSNISATINYSTYTSQFSASYSKNGEHNSLIYFDLFSDNSSSSRLLMTGLLGDQYSPLEYNVMNDYSGEFNFYYELSLLNEDTLLREDHASGILTFNAPTLSPQLNFNYASGITKYSPTPSFPTSEKIGIYFSGQLDNNFVEVTEDVITNELSAYGIFKMEHKDNGYLFDIHTLSGEAVRPTVTFSNNGISASKKLGYNFYLYPSKQSLGVKLFTKEAIALVSGSLDVEDFPAISFDDYNNYEYETLRTGPVYRDYIYSNVENLQYQYSDNSTTGIYSSGNHRWFKAVPFDGYGDGDPVDYFLDLYISSFDSIVLSEINTINQSLGSIDQTLNYAYRESIPSGIDEINLIYDALNFTSSPIIFHSLISPSRDNHIIASQTVGLPALDNSTIVFSDDIPTTGYLIDVLIQDPYVGNIASPVVPTPTPTPTVTVSPSLTPTPTPTPSPSPTNN